MMINLSFTGKRIVAGLTTSVLLLAVANLYFFHWFAGREKQIVFAAAIFAALSFIFVGPSLREVEEYRAGKRNKRGFD